MKILKFLSALSAIMIAGGVCSELCENKIYADDDKEIIFHSDFEDDIENWAPLGSGSLSIDREKSYTGSSSLNIKNRVKAWNGPKIAMTSYLVSGNIYDFEAYVYQESGEKQTMLFTLKFISSNGNTTFNTISSEDAESGEWIKLSGSIEIPDDMEDITMYIESSDPELDYNIDNISVSGVRPPNENFETESNNENVEGIKYDFEKDFENWFARGDIRLIRTDEQSFSGKYSLYATDRTSIWNGAQVEAPFVIPGESFVYSAYIMYNGEQFENSHNFYIQLQYEYEGNINYDVVVEKEVSKNSWSKLIGEYTVPEGAKNIALYIQTANIDEGCEPDANDLMDFYIDNICVADGASYIAAKNKKNIFISALVVSILSIILLVSLIIIKHIRKTKHDILMASMDAMTHVYNRNKYEQDLEKINQDTQKCKNIHTGIFDVNFLKYINDNFGHEKGDEAITRCADVLIRAVGKNGNIYRTGGDEFVCISDSSLEIQIKAELMKEFENDHGYKFSVAAGFAEYDKDIDGDNPDVRIILKRSDKNMYEEKQRMKSENKELARK